MTALSGLRVEPPDGFVDRVLDRVGLVDEWVLLDGPIGPLCVAFSTRGVSLVRLGADAEEFEAAFRRRLGRPVRRAVSVPGGIERALRTGRAPRELSFDLSGLTDFAREVLTVTASIPPGEIRSYGWVAREIGRPGAVRAVGTALGHNPVPVLIPCHRVVRGDGRIGDYAFGPAAKRSLLQAEGLDPDEMERLADRGVRFVGSDTSRIFCCPTCRDARRIGLAHRREFASEAAARAAGYRPCARCRPAA
jgi:O-6-methylguanine DNA methyltransferase